MRIVISGYYGFGNAGDEAVLSATLGELRRRLPQAELVVLSGDPAATREAHDVAAVPRWPLAPLRRTIASADLLLSGGGSLLQDQTSVRSLLYYLLTLHLARAARVPYVVHAQGIGPLRSRLGQLAAGFYLARAAAVTLRDEDSTRLAAELGLPAEHITLAADPAFLIEPVAGSETEAILARAGVEPGTALVGMVVRRWRGAQAVLPVLARIGRLAAEAWGARTVILPFQLPADREVSHELAALVPGVALIDWELHPRALAGVVGHLQLLVAMRLHALVFAAAQAVPAVGVCYDPKVAALCREARQGCVPVTAPERLVELAELAWAERSGGVQARRECVTTMRRRAGLAFDVIERVCRHLGASA
ncbi:MAG: polysaccharide pyruvyl transferase CsaB [Armatimonadota bacterium]